FSINLGKDEKNLVLHFNPRFDVLKDDRMIVLNSMVDNVYGEELRESFFPFQEGSDTTVSGSSPALRFFCQAPPLSSALLLAVARSSLRLVPSFLLPMLTRCSLPL
ncbi:hypothetical protein AB205_0203590, partial [Aquarana catesbeiana]